MFDLPLGHTGTDFDLRVQCTGTLSSVSTGLLGHSRNWMLPGRTKEVKGQLRSYLRDGLL